MTKTPAKPDRSPWRAVTVTVSVALLMCSGLVCGGLVAPSHPHHQVRASGQSSVVPAAVRTGATGGEGTLIGVPRVVDGDTLDLQGTSVRLYGIDAPEKRQSCQHADGSSYACGREAAGMLASLVDGRTVTCLPQARDHWGRTVAVCAAGGAEVNAAMVSSGWAVEYDAYSDGRYASLEEEAHAARRGLWSGPFEAPATFRKHARAP